MATQEKVIVIDGAGHIAGRLASVIAKELLKEKK
jgi:LSU ribosomal protein L13P